MVALIQNAATIELDYNIIRIIIKKIILYLKAR